MVMKRVALLTAPMLLWTSLATADPVVLTSGGGGFRNDGELTSFQVFGTNTRLWENARLLSLSPEPFSPGESVEFRGGILASPVPMQPVPFQLVNGTTYENVFLHGSLTFVGAPFIAPTGRETELRHFETTMSLVGHLAGFSTFDGKGTPLFTVDVTGTGRLSIGPYIFLNGTNGEQTWHLLPTAGGSFTITTPTSPEPVPEPATMLLLATGLAGALRVRSKYNSEVRVS